MSEIIQFGHRYAPWRYVIHCVYTDHGDNLHCQLAHYYHQGSIRAKRKLNKSGILETGYSMAMTWRLWQWPILTTSMGRLIVYTWGRSDYSLKPKMRQIERDVKLGWFWSRYYSLEVDIIPSRRQPCMSLSTGCRHSRSSRKRHQQVFEASVMREAYLLFRSALVGETRCPLYTRTHRQTDIHTDRQTQTYNCRQTDAETETER